MYSFLYYVSYTCYGFYFLALSCFVCFSLAMLGLILLKFETPSLEWNANYHYVPTVDKPRMLFFPVFNMEWFYDIPPFWTMFYPLHGRPYFTQAQMSLIDKNMPLLIQTLQNINNDAPEDNNNLENPPLQNPNQNIIIPGNVVIPPPNNHEAPIILPENTQQKSNTN